MKKLYYDDSHLTSFSSGVVSCEEAPGGYDIVLEQTAFYPEGGGQASDTGTLGTVRVLHVREEGETVVHLCDGPLTPGQTVTGIIDWQHRFDLMQQHSGEHIVSGIIHRMFSLHNVGFHMGSGETTIDFDGEIPPEAIPEIEYQANQAIWENLPVLCTVPAPEELEKAVYRTKRQLPYPVRLVEVPGYDRCACCGVHVKYTGEIGLIKILSAVRFRKGTRMQMVCGKRACLLLQRVCEENRQVSPACSAKLLETGRAAEKMNAQLAAERLRSTGILRQLFDRIAEDYRSKGNCLCLREGLSPAEVRELADRMADTCGGIAAVVSPRPEGSPVCLISRTEDVRPLGKALCQALSAHGGGKQESFQGSINASVSDINKFFVEKMNFYR